MILSIGELLVDMLGERVDGVQTFSAFCGGAPFNFALAAHRVGAVTGFIGRVGNDTMGRFLLAETKKAGLDYLSVQIDALRSTTLAFVTLTDGERDFSFARHDSADFNLDCAQVDFGSFQGLTTVHLGSLMLSESAGVDFAKRVVRKAKQLGLRLTFDVNYRKDIFGSARSARSAYAPFVAEADVVKFSEDELFDYTGLSDVASAARSVRRTHQLLLVTLGANGSAYFCDDGEGCVPSKPLDSIVDTTGAGDAFFGTFVAKIEGLPFDKSNVERALRIANLAGAEATQHKGAVQL